MRMLGRQVPCDLRLQQASKGFVHEVVFVGYIEADNARSQVRLEPFLKPVPVRPFHDEDHICPRYQLRRGWVLRVVVETSRGYFDAGMKGKYLFSRRATKPILAAQE